MSIMEEYTDLIKEMKKADNKMKNGKPMPDYEAAHSIQDQIYEKFIEDITSKRISGNDILKIAKLIDSGVVDNPGVTRWYA